MKNLFAIAISILLLSSCATPQPTGVQAFSAFQFLDYSVLTQGGIFVTESNSVSFEYTALGSVYVTARGGNHISKKYNGPFGVTEYQDNFESIDFTRIAKKLNMELLNMKADGIINLRVQYIPSDGRYGSGYTITGMAIRRNK